MEHIQCTIHVHEGVQTTPPPIIARQDSGNILAVVSFTSILIINARGREERRGRWKRRGGNMHLQLLGLPGIVLGFPSPQDSP